MALDEAFEARVSDHRARTRQDARVPFLIRDDGLLMPNVPLIAKKNNFRPYHGDVSAPLEERMRFLRGERTQRRVVNSAAAKVEAEAPFDIAKASKDELIRFAEDEYGLTIDPATHLNRIRADIARLAGLGGLREPAKSEEPAAA